MHDSPGCFRVSVVEPRGTRKVRRAHLCGNPHLISTVRVNLLFQLLRRNRGAPGCREHTGEERSPLQVSAQTASADLVTETSAAIEARAPTPAAVKSDEARIGIPTGHAAVA